MKKISVIIFITLLLILIAFTIRNYKNNTNPVSPLSITPKASPLINNSPTPLPVNGEKISIFVPYWSFSNQLQSEEYDQVFYFGISANERDIEKTDQGFAKLNQFLSFSKENKEKFLTLTMTDSKINSAILEKKETQEKIIDQAVLLAKEKEFNGILFDFETSSLSFQSVIDKITKLYQLFYKKTKENNLQFYITVYGDSIYQLRPYDIKEITKNADRVLIMAYDFHKARGNPGPNFPLFGKEDYGYDMTVMISDFLKIVPREKLTVVFGWFGYDWVVDDKDKGIGLAKPYSTIEMENRLNKSCKLWQCEKRRDNKSKETSVNYIDEEGKNHIIWYEDMVSIIEKKDYLKKVGITSYSYWAYSYF